MFFTSQTCKLLKYYVVQPHKTNAWKAHESLEIDNKLKKTKSQIKIIMKLMVQNKQVGNVKSSKFTLSSKTTVSKSPKTWNIFREKFLMIQKKLARVEKLLYHRQNYLTSCFWYFIENVMQLFCIIIFQKHEQHELK